MMKVIFCTIFILGMHIGCAQVLEDSIPDPSIIRSRPRPKDPVSNFLSGLGNLFLDIDETFSRQMAPKVNVEDRTKEQMYGRPRSGPSYFNRIRDNYRDVQKRLGESLGILDLRMSSDLGSVNVQNKGPESEVDVSIPFLPMKLAVKSNRGLKTSEDENDAIKATNFEPEPTSPRFRSSFKLGNSEIKVDSKLNPLEPSELLKNVEDQIKKTVEDLRSASDKNGGVKTEEDMQEPTSPQFRSSFKLGNSEIKMESKLDPLQPSELLKNVENQIKKTLEDLRTASDKNEGVQTEDNMQEMKRNHRPEITKEFSSRSGSESESSENPDDSNPEGRILGDVLYSESTFDKLTKRVMQDTKWVIDPKGFPSGILERLKLISDKAIDNIANTNSAKGKDTEASISKIPQQPEKHAVKQDLKKRKSLKPLGNNLETVMNYEKIEFIPDLDNNLEFGVQDSRRPKDSIILAFTPEGIPLKLRMGPEILNPLKFLNKALRTHGVSLNIPVASFDDIEPVGREILQLGSGSGGTMTRALYIDLSDSFQLESLLRTLKNTKRLQEIQRT